MDDGGDLSSRDAVEGVHVHHSGRIPPIEDRHAPRHCGLAAVQLLVEIVAQPADGLCQHDAGRDRIAEGGQRDTPSTAGDPGTDPAEGHRTPDAKTAFPDPQRGGRSGATLPEIRPPIGHQVVEASADQAERHGPQGDVVDHAAFASAGHPAAISDHQSGDDPGDDAQRVGADGDRTEVPHALRRAGKRGQQHRRHAAGTLSRTPPANSPVRVCTAETPSASAVTSAEPTITPSA